MANGRVPPEIPAGRQKTGVDGPDMVEAGARLARRYGDDRTEIQLYGMPNEPRPSKKTRKRTRGRAKTR
jgi:hypothetical protein